MSRLDSPEWQHGWRLSVGVTVLIAIRVVPVAMSVGAILWYLIDWTPLIPVKWCGIDRSAVNCTADSWVSDDQMTCVGAGHRYICVREFGNYQCAEVTP